MAYVVSDEELETFKLWYPEIEWVSVSEKLSKEMLEQEELDVQDD